MEPLLRALWRFGGILVQPRATASALRPDEGRRDGLWLGALYVLGTGALELMRGIATLKATANFSGALMLAAALGRVLVVPIIVLVACETVLGRERSYRRGLLLVPLLVVVTLAHELAVHGVVLRSFLPEIVGGLLCIALAWRVRDPLLPEETTT